MNNLSAQYEQLSAEWRMMKQGWEATGKQWNDEVFEKFSAQHLDPLAQLTVSTLRSMERLVRVIDEAERRLK